MRRLGLLCKLTVSGSISLGFRRSFHLSLTVLVHYRVSACIVVLEGGPPSFPPGSTCPMVLGNSSHSASGQFHLPDCHRLWSAVPDRSIIARHETSLQRETPVEPRNPMMATSAVLTPPRFRHRALSLAATNALSYLISLPAVTEMFHFSACRSHRLCIQRRVSTHDGRGVSPFGYPRINACLRLPEAFRSLPRPSSPSETKASTMSPS